MDLLASIQIVEIKSKVIRVWYIKIEPVKTTRTLKWQLPWQKCQNVIKILINGKMAGHRRREAVHSGLRVVGVFFSICTKLIDYFKVIMRLFARAQAAVAGNMQCSELSLFFHLRHAFLFFIKCSPRCTTFCSFGSFYIISPFFMILMVKWNRIKIASL